MCLRYCLQPHIITQDPLIAQILHFTQEIMWIQIIMDLQQYIASIHKGLFMHLGTVRHILPRAYWWQLKYEVRRIEQSEDWFYKRGDGMFYFLPTSNLKRWVFSVISEMLKCIVSETQMNRDVTMPFRVLRPHCFLTKKSKDRGRKELSKRYILSTFDVFSIYFKSITVHHNAHIRMSQRFFFCEAAEDFH